MRLSLAGSDARPWRASVGTMLALVSGRRPLSRRTPHDRGTKVIRVHNGDVPTGG